ncbi:MAG: hypothetical protein E6Q97_16100 [Desulfurellales bacterium]|nr:MAG: hypothetical protein E6Q97_16100 [Desulfurellales bacterium]
MGRRRNDKLKLSPTERRLVGLLCLTGGTNKQLAVKLHMSGRTAANVSAPELAEQLPNMFRPRLTDSGQS